MSRKPTLEEDVQKVSLFVKGGLTLLCWAVAVVVGAIINSFCHNWKLAVGITIIMGIALTRIFLHPIQVS